MQKPDIVELLLSRGSVGEKETELIVSNITIAERESGTSEQRKECLQEVREKRLEQNTLRQLHFNFTSSPLVTNVDISYFYLTPHNLHVFKTLS